MSEASNQQIATSETVLSKLHHFVFPTVYKNCYQVEVITKDKQLYPTDTENSTPPLYQLLDHILLDKYSNFNEGVQAACAPNRQGQMHPQVEPWKDVSDIYVPKTKTSLSFLQKLVENTDKEQEEEKSSPTPKDILISRLKNILVEEWFNYRLGCVNNRIYPFPRPDGSIYFGISPQCDSDKVAYEMFQKLYNDSVNTFIELILKAIDEDNVHGQFSIHMAANLSANAIDTERDEFLAIVTPNNNTIIIMGFFYNRFYG